MSNFSWPAAAPLAMTAFRSPRRGAVPAFVVAVVAVFTVVASAHAQPAGDVREGQALYEAKCGGCHSLDQNRVGPRHRGVVGRKVASIADYDYSPAIRNLGGVWNPARIDQWLQGPQALAP